MTETIEIEIEDDLFFELALMAHKRDITVNKLVEIILTDYIDACNPICTQDLTTK